MASSESFPPGGRAFRLEPDKVEAGWQKFLAAQNVAGQGVGTQISTAFITAFALLDFAIAPKGALVPLLLTRTVVVAGTVTFLLTRNYPVVVRHHFLATSLHAIWNACGIGLLIVFMGGFGSAYYPSIMLVMMGVSIIFVWPVRVAAVTHLCLTLAYVVPCALFGPARSAADVFGSSSIVLGTGLLGTLAQTLQYNAQRRLFSARHQLDLLRTAAENDRAALAAQSAALSTANDQLKVLDDAKNRFFANISHELRTPLTLILGVCNTLSTHEEPAVSQAAHMALRNSARLLRLVNDILSLVKLEGGRERPLQKGVFDVLELARVVVSNFEGAPCPVRLTCTSAASEPAEVDDKQLRTVLYNLVSNAIKFSPGKGAVDIEVAGDASSVTISVKDRGVGIPEAQLTRIFQRFAQVEEAATRSFEGTGIGLALVKEIVEAHAGGIHVTSTEGAGSVFTVVLPRGDVTTSPIQPVEEAQLDAVYRGVHAGSGTTEPRRAGRNLAEVLADDAPEIVLAEDNDDLRAYIAQVLGGHFRVRPCNDGVEALAAILERKPALIVTDQMMPRMSGSQLLAELQRTDATKRVPVLMLSARSELDAPTVALEQGAGDYLGKPFRDEELVARCRNLIRMQQQERSLADLNAELQALNHRLEVMALRDPLTDLYNRRHFETVLEEEWNRMRRVEGDVALLMCDVDHFKKYNDAHGHQRGDACLVAVANILQEAVGRTSDTVARYGGEEFVIVLPATDQVGAEVVARRIVKALAAAEVPHGASPTASFVTLSVGAVALAPTEYEDRRVLVQLADAALYRAKSEGRNRVVVASATDLPRTPSGRPALVASWRAGPRPVRRD